jgi:hypothetical protein
MQKNGGKKIKPKIRIPVQILILILLLNRRRRLIFKRGMLTSVIVVFKKLGEPGARLSQGFPPPASTRSMRVKSKHFTFRLTAGVDADGCGRDDRAPRRSRQAWGHRPGNPFDFLDFEIAREKTVGELEKGIANLWRRKRITKVAHAGRAQESKSEIPGNTVQRM